VRARGRWLAVGGVAGALGYLLWQGPHHPTIEVEPGSVEFGIIGQEPATATVRIANTGGATLHLGKVTASCPCVRVALGHGILDPGQGTSLTVRYDPRRASPPDSGPVRYSISVPSDDPLTRHMQIAVSAAVRPRPR